MTKIVQEEYLRAYLDGVSIDRRYEDNDWKTFTSSKMLLSCFNDENFTFRYTPKVVEVSLEDFYADYDKVLNTTKTIGWYLSVQDLIDKYLPRNGANGDIK